MKNIIFISSVDSSRKKYIGLAQDAAREYELAVNSGNTPSLLIIDNQREEILGLRSYSSFQDRFETELRKRRFRGVMLNLSFLGGSINDHRLTLLLRGYTPKDLSAIETTSHSLVGCRLKKRKTRASSVH